MYAEPAEIDRGHHHECLYWAERERENAEETAARIRAKGLKYRCCGMRYEEGMWMVMRISRRWIEQAQRLLRNSRRGRSAQRVRLTLETCRRCKRRSYMLAGSDRLCDSCVSLRSQTP
ncbi:MAG: AMED_5909 family protein [Pseudonocardiaceae bacterium]